MSSIPTFPEYKLLSLEDRVDVEKYMSLTQQEISECTFSNFFVWRKSFALGISLLDSTLLTMTFYPDGRQLCMVPFGAKDPVRLIKTICDEFKGGKVISNHGGLPHDLRMPELYFVPRSYNFQNTGDIDLGERLKSSGFTITTDRDNWDYVYLTKDLIDLDGTRYHSKKKAMNKCLSHYKCTFEPMTVRIIPECIEFEIEWCKQMNCSEDKSLVQENEAVDEALEYFNKLGFIGGVVWINGKIEALTIGERLNESTAVVHFEKANLSIDGLYQVINNWFCKEMLSGYEFVNREQDLGKPGIRKAKMSYRPHHMVEKHLAHMA